MNEFLTILINKIDLEKSNESFPKRGKHIVLSYLYNEEWLIKWFMNYLSENYSKLSDKIKDDLTNSSNWFSEASLGVPTIDGSRVVGYTKADGIMGDFGFTDKNSSQVVFNEDAKNIVFLEAKMGSGFSSKTKKTKLDQLSRYILSAFHMSKNINSDDFEIKITSILPKSSLSREPIYYYLPIKDDDIPLNFSTSKVEEKKFYESMRDNIMQRKIKSISDETNVKSEDIKLFIEKHIKLSYILWEDIVECIGDNSFKDYYVKCCRYNNVNTDLE